MVLWQIFFSFMKIGLFAVGGAYSFLPLIQKEVVDRYHWLTKEEFLEVLGVVKIFPGAISIKFATYTGYKIAGIPGAVMANIGNLLSPVILILIATYFYAKYKETPRIKSAFETIQLVIFAMIIAVAFQTVTLSQVSNIQSAAIIVVAFILFFFTKVDPALIIIGAGLIGAAAFH
ncbi:MAG TPA: chromate transporter [Candidatus Omnitrophota bacterium]|nr:chromate transporter [Candidatus Omnitrophota bacterium]